MTAPTTNPLWADLTIPPPRALRELWLSLALRLQSERLLFPGRALVLGLLGVQGAGKSTLSAALCLSLERLGLKAVSLSLDDFYLTWAQRQILRQREPRYIRRGPPGTHDLELAQQVLNALRSASGAIEVPHFDKGARGGEGDRLNGRWVEGPVDVVIFEGWFVGCQPVAQEALAPPLIDPAEQDWALQINRELAAYLPLWQFLDRLWVLHPMDYQLSRQWRKEAEQSLRIEGRGSMSDAEMDDFVDYFWRSLHPEVYVSPLLQQGSDLVIVLDANRQVTALYSPKP